ncbi:MAG: transposase [Desulfomonile tiedjei]|uniref:Transposase n=1 Tax=Desulfomonile tiedjei TaxID=2358 RepID=A0A9D6Z4D4_9BACT|nr:transposase [Desulfomonile tiedjei]
MGRSRYKTVAGHDTYFATCTVVNWLPLFTKPELAEIVLNSFQYLHQQDRIALHAYVVMENHIHFIATADSFSDELRNFKSFTAKKIVDLLRLGGPSFYLGEMRVSKKRHKTDQTYQVWQEGSHPEAIAGGEVLRQKIECIHFNPVRRGYVDQPEYWRYSSARDYSGQGGLIPIEVVS